MRYFLDTEFYERPNGQGGGGIDLISIGIVAEDGREMYAENDLFNWGHVDLQAQTAHETAKWLMLNVKPHLIGGWASLHPGEITSHILRLTEGDDKPQFWGWYCDYDWVVFCWLFGRMVDLPKNFPMYCRDFKQVMNYFPNTRLPKLGGNEHNALDDARQLRAQWEWLRGQQMDEITVGLFA